jgi:hypothetical protein
MAGGAPPLGLATPFERVAAPAPDQALERWGVSWKDMARQPRVVRGGAATPIDFSVLPATLPASVASCLILEDVPIVKSLTSSYT